MFKPLSVAIGLRYIRAKRRNGFISFISMFSMVGMMLGVATLIIVLSVMNGFDRELKTRILGMVPHGIIYLKEPSSDWEKHVDNIKKNERITGVAPYIQLQGMLTTNGFVQGSLLTGIDPKAEAEVSIVDDYIVQGALEDLTKGSFGMVIGAGLAAQLGLTVGEKVTLVLPEASVSIAGITPRFKRFTIVSIFETKAELDYSTAYIHWYDASLLNKTKGKISAARIQVDDLFKAREVMRSIVNDNWGRYSGQDWTYSHGTLFNAIRMEKTMIGLLLFLIVLIAAFNIVSSLVMLVTDKRGDIAILRTLGATPSMIRRTFMIQGFMIGIIGTLLGMLLGVIVALNISDIFRWIETTFNTSLLNAYFVNFLPSELNFADVFLVSGAALFISFLATLYPSYRASKIQPAEALRYE